MQALWLEDGRVTVRNDVPVPEPPPGEALIRVTCAGVCSTDRELVKGYYPYAGVLGHEFVGVVEKGDTPLLGKRVVGEINAVCHACDACRAGRSNHCARRTVLGIVGRNGAFAEYLALPAGNLHAVPDHLSDDAATFTEPLAAALRIGEQIDVTPADRVLVVGAGRLGQLVARALRGRCELTVVARHPAKRALLDACGIRTVASGGECAAASFDVVVECTGNADGFAQARRAIRPAGTLVMKSTYAAALTFDASALVVDEIRLVGSRCGPFAPALAMLADGAIDPRPLIHGALPLSRADEALAEAGRAGVVKVLIRPGEAPSAGA